MNRIVMSLRRMEVSVKAERREYMTRENREDFTIQW